MMLFYLLVSRFMGVNKMRKKEKEILFGVFISEFRRNKQHNLTCIKSQSKWSNF